MRWSPSFPPRLRAGLLIALSTIAAATTVGRGASMPPAVAGVATVVLAPQDTYLNLDANNYSSDPILATYTWPDYQRANVIVMRFDLSALPSDAAISQAVLRLSLVASDGVADGYSVSAHKVTGVPPVIARATGYSADGVTGWTANACCSGGVPLAQGDISGAYDTRVIDTVPGPKVWDLTGMAQEWLADPSRNLGLVLNADASTPKDRYRYFASTEHADATARPVLTVTYSAADTTPPVVAIATPGAGAVLAKAVAISATATDNAGVAGVQFLIDGIATGGEDTTAPYAMTWDSTAVSDGPHVVSAIARDLSGNRSTAAVNVAVKNGLVLLRPQDTTLKLDNTNYSQDPTLSAYTWPDYQPYNAIAMSFDLSAIPAGAMVQQATLNLSLVQSDGVADTYAIGARKIVGVKPLIANASGISADGTTNWTPNPCCAYGVPLAQADVSPPYDVQAIAATPGVTSWTLTALVQEWLADPASNFGMVLNPDVLKAKDRFRFFASMEHPDPTLRPLLRVTYVTDTTPPQAWLESPSGGTTVSGIVPMMAVATDDTGVAGVHFTLDGAPLNAETAVAPYVLSWNSTATSNGVHILAAVARDLAGNTATSPLIAVTVSNDTIAPAVSVTSPLKGATVSGAIVVRANASDNVGVAGVQFKLDGANLGSEVTTAPYSVAWNTASAANGTHALTAVARDAAGNTITPAALTVTVSNATSPLSVALISPSSGTMVSGMVSVRATASSKTGIMGVQFRLDGARLGAEDTVAPYSVSWNTASATNGKHTLTAVARDAAGRRTTSAGVTIGIGTDTMPPLISLLTAASLTVSSAAMAWTTNEVSDSQVDYGLTTAYGSSSALSATLVTAHAVTLSGLSSGTTYHARVRSRDAAGNLAVSGDTTFATLSALLGAKGIAAQYPGDVDIEHHPDVVFVERFDEATLSDLFSRWTDVLNGGSMSFTADVPAGSPGTRSLTIPWQGGGVSNGGHLYKQLTPGVDDTLYVRYYIKYPTSGTYQHSGVWMGGYNPGLSWPYPQAGVKPVGNERFSAAAEQDPLSSRFDHYDYWMNMHQAIDGNYWGNRLLNNPEVSATTGQWMCVEQMVKLNNPVSASNGEHAIWLNGVPISHVSQGSPNGTWSGGNFTQSATGTPFPGLQWRSDASLNLNWIWLQAYASTDPPGFQADMKFDHVIVAKSYVGCLTPASGADLIPPSVSLTGPSAGASVAGTVTVSASASDNVGVAGVQFRLDGANLGGEATSAPYSIAWDTTGVANGAHVLAAVARDAAGNVTSSTSLGVTVNNLGAGAGLLFESNWDAASGTSAAAVTDGGRWPLYDEFNHGDGTQLLSVVSGGPNGHNALRVQQRGATYAANLQKPAFIAPSHDYYVRYYMKNDDTSPAGDHIVTPDIYRYESLTYMRKFSAPTNWSFVIGVYGCGYTYPIGYWRPTASLAHGQWYRLEYYVHFTNATHIQVHPRIYDASGTLVFSDAQFSQSDPGSATWNGRSDWTLASYYAGGNDFCVDPTALSTFGVGNNGQQAAVDTGQDRYFAGVQIRTDTWPGPIPSFAPEPASVPAPESAPMPFAFAPFTGTRTGLRRRAGR